MYVYSRMKYTDYLPYLLHTSDINGEVVGCEAFSIRSLHGEVPSVPAADLGDSENAAGQVKAGDVTGQGQLHIPPVQPVCHLRGVGVGGEVQ